MLKMHVARTAAYMSSESLVPSGAVANDGESHLTPNCAGARVAQQTKAAKAVARACHGNTPAARSVNCRRSDVFDTWLESNDQKQRRGFNKC
jgi:hypothetical protein